jgi:hypothetical protein
LVDQWQDDRRPATRVIVWSPAKRVEVKLNLFNDISIEPEWAHPCRRRTGHAGLKNIRQNAPLVDRDNTTRRARRLDVQSDVGELSLGS